MFCPLCDLPKIAPLSVRSVLPSVVNNGVAPELFVFFTGFLLLSCSARIDVVPCGGRKKSPRTHL